MRTLLSFASISGIYNLNKHVFGDSLKHFFVGKSEGISRLLGIVGFGLKIAVITDTKMYHSAIMFLAWLYCHRACQVKMRGWQGGSIIEPCEICLLP